MLGVIFSRRNRSFCRFTYALSVALFLIHSVSIAFPDTFRGIRNANVRGLKGDDVVRLDLKKQKLKNTRVAVEIDLDGHVVQVVRHRKHHKFENKLLLFIDGKEITVGAGDRETQVKLDELLQIDADSFINAVLFPQEAKGFASLTDAEQKAILDKLLGNGAVLARPGTCQGQAQEVSEQRGISQSHTNR